MKSKLIRNTALIILVVVLISSSTLSSFADSEAPIITGQWERNVIGETRAVIHWETNEPAIGGVEWGLTTQYGNIVNESGTYITEHIIDITGLTRDTNYYVRIFAIDPSNNTGYLSFELGTYPKGHETKTDYTIIMIAVAVIALFLIIAVILIYRHKQKS
jgi:preprotein translocase subunit SecE